MNGQPEFDVIIVGGGLAGLTAAIALGKAGRKVLLLEKKTYPYHKVCGEYVSNEVLDYLKWLGFDPYHYGAASITKLRISAPNGSNIHTALDLGAFALSRYRMDYELAQLAIKNGAQVMTGTRVTDIQFSGSSFSVAAGNDVFTSTFVIGSWGKRETLDKKLNRSFMNERTNYMAVKYHVRTDYPIDEIGLDNFAGGYSGIAKIEEDRYNICSFYRRSSDKNKHTSIHAFREEVMYRNPTLRRLFEASDFLYDDPVVINEICFSAKPPVENHILMCGDSAGLIAPLCGNGMSMAIAGAKIATDLLAASGLLDRTVVTAQQRQQLEEAYHTAWTRQFGRRLFWGRTIQRLFGHPKLTSIALKTIHAVPLLERSIIGTTHGQPIIVEDQLLEKAASFLH